MFIIIIIIVAIIIIIIIIIIIVTSPYQRNTIQTLLVKLLGKLIRLELAEDSQTLSSSTKRCKGLYVHLFWEKFILKLWKKTPDIQADYQEKHIMTELLYLSLNTLAKIYVFKVTIKVQEKGVKYVQI